MAEHDPIIINLPRVAALEAVAERTGLKLGQFSVKADGLRFETVGSHGSAAVHIEMVAIISSRTLSEVILASGLIVDPETADSEVTP